MPKGNGGTGLISTGTSGNVLTSDGTNWVSSAIGNAATVTNGVYTGDFTGSNQSLTTDGYQKLVGGLIIQWGYISFVANSTVTITYPIAFSTSTLNAQVSMIYSGSDSTDFNALRIKSYSATQLVTRNSTGTACNAFWFAIGY